MNIWANSPSHGQPPAGTPQIAVLPAPTGASVVVNGQPAFTGTYQQCRLYAQNNYGLTATMYLPIHAEYERVFNEQVALADTMAKELIDEERAAHIPDVKPQNKYRKEGK